MPVSLMLSMKKLPFCYKLHEIGNARCYMVIWCICSGKRLHVISTSIPVVVSDCISLTRCVNQQWRRFIAIHIPAWLYIYLSYQPWQRNADRIWIVYWNCSRPKLLCRTTYSGGHCGVALISDNLDRYFLLADLVNDLNRFGKCS